MGINDSLAGSDAATEEELRVEAREGRSEGSRCSKPTRGAPPSSLSQPILSDRSRSSSPIKRSNLPVVKHPLPSKSKATPTPSIPRSSNRRSTDSNSTPRNDPSVLRGGRSALASRVGGLRQHLFLPRTQADKSPASLSFLPQSSSPETVSHRLPTITEYSAGEQEAREDEQRRKGKRRITDEFVSPPTSPRVLNVGYGTPFKSSSQFFTRPGGIPLPSSDTMSQQNVLVGLGLPHTPAFENVPITRDSQPSANVTTQIRSRASNPFKGRPLPPHMRESLQERRDDLGQASSSSVNRQNSEATGNQRQRPIESRSERGSSRGRSPSTENHRVRNFEGQPDGDPDGSDDGDGENPHRNHNPYNRRPPNNSSPSSPGGGGNPGGGGGGNCPSAGGGYSNPQPQGNIPYGNLVATIRNELKQDQLPVWDGNKDTAIEYFWKIQQLAALEGDIPVALGYWLWKSLKENSRIWMWFTTLPFAEQSKMRTHYLHYLKGIKDNYLG